MHMSPSITLAVFPPPGIRLDPLSNEQFARSVVEPIRTLSRHLPGGITRIVFFPRGDSTKEEYPPECGQPPHAVTATEQALRPHLGEFPAHVHVEVRALLRVEHDAAASDAAAVYCKAQGVSSMISWFVSETKLSVEEIARHVSMLVAERAMHGSFLVTRLGTSMQ